MGSTRCSDIAVQEHNRFSQQGSSTGGGAYQNFTQDGAHILGDAHQMRLGLEHAFCYWNSAILAGYMPIHPNVLLQACTRVEGDITYPVHIPFHLVHDYHRVQYMHGRLVFLPGYDTFVYVTYQQS